MSLEELANKFEEDNEKEFENKDLLSLKRLAISEGADADKVNACQDRSCVLTIISSLRCEQIVEPKNENVSLK